MSRRIQNKEEFLDAISEVMSPIVEERDVIFDFNSGELWKFAIYLYDPRPHILKPIWREKHQKHPSKASSERTWSPGQGHIGQAFVQNENLITGDATEAEVSKLLKLPEKKYKAYDTEIYRSFASILIGPVHEGEMPLGVLVATSNRAGRYHRLNSLMLRHAAGVIANLIQLNNLTPEIVFAEPEDAGPPPAESGDR